MFDSRGSQWNVSLQENNSEPLNLLSTRTKNHPYTLMFSFFLWNSLNDRTVTLMTARERERERERETPDPTLSQVASVFPKPWLSEQEKILVSTVHVCVCSSQSLRPECLKRPCQALLKAPDERRWPRGPKYQQPCQLLGDCAS